MCCVRIALLEVVLHMHFVRAALLGYPCNFEFPAQLTESQCCALLGNGLSLQCAVPVVEYLLHGFLKSPGSTE
jgi:hypothetical protein